MSFLYEHSGGCLGVSEDPKHLIERNWQLNFAIFILSLINKYLWSND